MAKRKRGNVRFLSLEGIQELSQRNLGIPPGDVSAEQARHMLKALDDDKLLTAFRSGRRLLELMAEEELEDTGMLQGLALREQNQWTNMLLSELSLRKLEQDAGIILKAEEMPKNTED